MRAIEGRGSDVVRRLLSAIAAVILALAPIQPSGVRAVTPIDVTVTIMRFVQVQDPDPAPFQGDGDYYAKVRIGGFAFQDTASQNTESADFSPFWRFTRTVDQDLGSVPITIQIWDADVFPSAPDDIIDINPTDGVQELSLSLNLNTGAWSGDVPANVGVSTGDGDHEEFGLTEGGEAGRVFFDISLGNGDIDGDGIPDGVERFGVRDTNGNLVADMAALGADPCRKTVALEIDWMQGAADGHNHMPKPAAVTEAKNAFSAAPVPVVNPCPYPGFPNGTGANLVVDVSNSIPEAPILGLDSDFSAVRDANFNSSRRPFFHYLVFVHDQAAGTSSSGLCCSDNRDYIASLGSWRLGCIGPGPNGVRNTTPTGDDVISGQGIIGGPNRTCDSTAAGDDTQDQTVGGGAADYEVGTVRDQSGTILHELGHALGLGHGGVEGTNYKPNYLSVMNYAFDPGGVPDRTNSNFRLDYSRSALPNLTETALSEAAGIGDGNAFTLWTDPAGVLRGAAGDSPINWNNQGGIQGGTVNVDVNNDGACVSAGPNGTLETSPSGDDVVTGTNIRNGPNHACNTVRTGDDKQDVDNKVGCVGFGGNGTRDTTPAGDDFTVMNGSTEVYIAAGADFICNTTATGDDLQIAPVGQTEPGPLLGWDDWSNIKYRAALSVDAGGAAFEHGPDITAEEAARNEAFFAAFFDPDLKIDKTADKADAAPGETVTYTVKVDDIGTGEATAIKLDDTKPDNTVESRNLANIVPGGTHSETFTYLIPCATADTTVLTNSATVSGKNLLLAPEKVTTNNTDTAATTVHAPVLTLSKSATATVNAGEAITYTLTYENTGSGTAANVVVTDTLPAGVYYSKALDLGAGPKPDTVALNGDGTRTLVWNVGTLAAASGPKTIVFTARPTLLALGGTSFVNQRRARLPVDRGLRVCRPARVRRHDHHGRRALQGPAVAGVLGQPPGRMDVGDPGSCPGDRPTL